jgi:phenylacetate-CoA ligase
MHPSVVRHVIDPYFQWRMGRRPGRALRALECSQWYPDEQLREIQWTKMQRLLRHAAARVPYYRALFRELGASPEDFKGLEDVRRLPILAKQTVRDRGTELIAEGPVRLSQRMTSGSTGIPLLTYIDAHCWGPWLAAERRSRQWWGIRIGDRGARLTTSHHTREHGFKQRHLLNYGLFSVVDLSDTAMEALYHGLISFRPAFVFGTSTPLAHLARFMLAHGGERLRPRVVFSTGEVLHPYQRALIGQAFDCPVANEYGASEIWFVAAECPAGRMHIIAENVHVEFERVEHDDEILEIVITDLCNYGMPLIRYAIGDLGVPVAGHCPCGRGLPLMELRGGRTGDLAMFPDGRYFDNTVLCEIFQPDLLFQQGRAPRVRQYRIIQEEPGRFTVLLDADRSDQTAEMIKARFHQVLGGGHTVDVQFVEEIPRDPSGKLRHFVSRITASEARRSLGEPTGAGSER